MNTRRSSTARIAMPTLLALVCGALAGCRDAAPVRDAGAVVVVATRHGIASHYGARFAGRTTASGEPHDPRALTAAHRTLPFGTRVRVSRVGGSGPPVIVRINDRGPYGEGRILDLSDEAARRLGMLGTVARVKAEILKD